MPSLSAHEDTSSQFAKREKIAAPLVKAIGTFFAVTGPRALNPLAATRIVKVPRGAVDTTYPGP